MPDTEELRAAIRKLHGCEVGDHLGSFPIRETFQGLLVWEGTVEAYELKDHPKAKRCYAWSHLEGKNDDQIRYIAVLEVPPVDTALKAVRAAIVSQARGQS